MVTRVHEHVGSIDCPNPDCKKDTPVKKTGTGKLSIKCRWCEFENYATPGTPHFKNIMSRLRPAPAGSVDPDDGALPKPTPTPTPTPTPAPLVTRKYAHER